MEEEDYTLNLANPPSGEWWVDSLKLTDRSGSPDKIFGLSKENVNGLWKEKREITEKIGVIINSLLVIENSLELIITDCFFKKQLVNKDIIEITHEEKLFGELLLKREFFTTMNKWRVLRGLSKSHPFFEGKNIRSLLTKLKETINIRDRFAHGDIIFKELKYPILTYYEDGYKEQNLSESYFEEINLKFKEVHLELVRISIDLRKFYQKSPESDSEEKI